MKMEVWVTARGKNNFKLNLNVNNNFKVSEQKKVLPLSI